MVSLSIRRSCILDPGLEPMCSPGCFKRLSLRTIEHPPSFKPLFGIMCEKFVWKVPWSELAAKNSVYYVPDGLEKWGLALGDTSCLPHPLQTLVGDAWAPGMLPFYNHLHISQLCWPNHQASWWLLFGSCFKKRISFIETMDFFIHVWMDLGSLFQCWIVCPIDKKVNKDT